jgi:hypothetical protein
MPYRMGRGFGDFGGCGCAAPFEVYNNPNGSCGCYCPDNLFTLNDPVAGRSCVSNCPPGTKPSGQPYDWGYPGNSLILSQSQACIADPSYVPPGSQLNLQTGAVSAIGTPGSPTGPQIAPASSPVPPPAAMSTPLTAAPQSSSTVLSSGIPSNVASLPGGFSLPSTIDGYSVSSIPWWMWAIGAGFAVWGLSKA